MEAENYIDLTHAARLSPGKPHASTIWRWCRKGVKARSGERIRLEHIRAGGRIFTTAKALKCFFERVTEADQEHFQSDQPEPTRRLRFVTDRQRQRSYDRDIQTLKAAGIL